MSSELMRSYIDLLKEYEIQPPTAQQPTKPALSRRDGQNYPANLLADPQLDVGYEAFTISRYDTKPLWVNQLIAGSKQNKWQFRLPTKDDNKGDYQDRANWYAIVKNPQHFEEFLKIIPKNEPVLYRMNQAAANIQARRQVSETDQQDSD